MPLHLTGLAEAGEAVARFVRARPGGNDPRNADAMAFLVDTPAVAPWSVRVNVTLPGTCCERSTR